MYDEILEVKNLPDWAYFDEYTYVRCYRTKKDYEDGATSKVKIPSVYDYVSLSIPFLRVKNIKTIGDFVGWLNTVGYCKSIMGLEYCGVYFNKDTWKWYTNQDKSEPMIKLSKYGIPPLGEEVKWKASNWSRLHNKLTVILEVQYSIDLGIPSWMYEKQGYKFTPPEYTFMSLPKEGTKGTYMGVEIEVASEITMQEIQRAVVKVEPKQDPFFYFKHDGSINDEQEGEPFEIVTFPCTPRFLRKNLRILFQKLREIDPQFESKIKTDETCGVHVHIGSNSFVDRLHKKKFITIWNQYDKKNSTFVQQLARRNFTNYCKPHSGSQGVSLARRLKNGVYASDYSDSKYSACRETDNTVEVRVFKGGFNYEHLLYCLDTVMAVHEFSYHSPIRTISSPMFITEFKRWLNKQPKYMKLKKELV